MSRSLATVQRISSITPIEGADAIECARVLGWDVVVKKGEFREGDFAVYLEIDSVPPDEPEYHFLWKNTEMRPNNFRIRTIKLRGQISQGILFPVSLISGRDVWTGRDVTEFLGITKYEPPLPRGSADIEGQFFDGVPKTDEDRVQIRADLVRDLTNRQYYITVKCDGASMTVAMHDDEPKVASRNYRLADAPDSAYWNAARNGGLLDIIKDNPNLAIQGELVGPGIQGNKMGLTEHKCLVFNIYDRDLGLHLSFVEMIEWIGAWQESYRIQMVPVLTFGWFFNETQETLLAMAEGKYDGTANEREGIVIRSQATQPRISFKAISNRFLLKGGD